MKKILSKNELHQNGEPVHSHYRPLFPGYMGISESAARRLQFLGINKTGFVILTEKPEFLLGILCSRLMDYYYRHEFPAWGDPLKGGRVQFRGDRMKAVPIVDHDAILCETIESTVQCIISQKSAENTADIAQLERKLDILVYKLYNLSYHEILLIEPDFMLTEKEYETFNIES